MDFHDLLIEGLFQRRHYYKFSREFCIRRRHDSFSGNQCFAEISLRNSEQIVKQKKMELEADRIRGSERRIFCWNSHLETSISR